MEVCQKPLFDGQLKSHIFEGRLMLSIGNDIFLYSLLIKLYIILGSLSMSFVTIDVQMLTSSCRFLEETFSC